MSNASLSAVRVAPNAANGNLTHDADFHETLACVARENPRIELGTVQICVLVAMRLLTEDEVLPELNPPSTSGARRPRSTATTPRSLGYPLSVTCLVWSTSAGDKSCC